MIEKKSYRGWDLVKGEKEGGVGTCRWGIIIRKKQDG
jgi:hypothetical protein